MIFRLAVSIILSVALLSQSQAASFDCSKASTFAEKTICSDQKLSELDEQMSFLYRKALESAAAPQSLKDVQSWWLTAKRDACRDRRCLEEVYLQRIQELNAVLTFANKSGITSGQKPMPGADNLSAAREQPYSQPARVTSTKSPPSFIDGAGAEYKATENEHGITLRSSDTTIYLGKSCDAFSPQYGEGKWGWSNSGVAVQLQKMNIQFPRQPSPFPTEHCPLGEQRQAQVSMAGPAQKGVLQPKTVVEEKSFSMSGKIGTQQEIKAALKISGIQITGSYFNVDENFEAKLAGTVDDRKNIVINEYDESGANNAFFVGKFTSDSTIEGYRTKPSQNTTQPFYLKMQGPASAASDSQGALQKLSPNPTGPEPNRQQPREFDIGKSQTTQTSPNTVQIQPTGGDDQPTTVTLVSSGFGITPEDSVKNALSNAVEQAVGLIVDAETIVKNDQIIKEQVLTYSNAYVSKYQELARENRPDGLIAVKIKADVEKKKLAEKLAPMMVTTGSVEGKNLFAQAVTQLKEEKDAAAIIRKIFEGFPGNVLEAKPVGTRIISKTESEVTVCLTVRFAVDPDRYSQWVEASKGHLGKIALETITQRWSPEKLGLGPLKGNWPDYSDAAKSREAWGSLELPVEERSRSFRVTEPSHYGWFPEAVKGKPVLAVVEKPGSSPVSIYVLTDDLFSQAVALASSVPLVTVVLLDSGRKEIDAQDSTGFFKTPRAGVTAYASPFWVKHGWDLVPAAKYVYYMSHMFTSDMKPEQDRIKFIRERCQTIIMPYVGATYAEDEAMLSAFTQDYIFKLSPQQLAEVATVEVKISSRNNPLESRAGSHN